MFQIKRFDCALVSVHLKATGLENEDLGRLQEEVDKISDLIEAIQEQLPGNTSLCIKPCRYDITNLFLNFLLLNCTLKSKIYLQSGVTSSLGHMISLRAILSYLNCKEHYCVKPYNDSPHVLMFMIKHIGQMLLFSRYR